jgi:thiamine pyrophosphokinase
MKMGYLDSLDNELLNKYKKIKNRKILIDVFFYL